MASMSFATKNINFGKQFTTLSPNLGQVLHKAGENSTLKKTPTFDLELWHILQNMKLS